MLKYTEPRNITPLKGACMFRLDGIDTHITSHGLAQICEWVNLNPLSANITKWSNTLKQFVGKLPTNCLSVFDHFVGLALKGLITHQEACLCDRESTINTEVATGVFCKKKLFLKISQNSQNQVF